MSESIRNINDQTMFGLVAEFLYKLQSEQVNVTGAAHGAGLTRFQYEDAFLTVAHAVTEENPESVSKYDAHIYGEDKHYCYRDPKTGELYKGSRCLSEIQFRLVKITAAELNILGQIPTMSGVSDVRTQYTGTELAFTYQGLRLQIVLTKGFFGVEAGSPTLSVTMECQRDDKVRVAKKGSHSYGCFEELRSFFAVLHAQCHLKRWEHIITH